MRSQILYALIIILGLASCGTTDEQSYNNYHDENVVQSLKDGWLPPNMTMEATSIREIHDYENGHVIGLYSYDESPFQPGLKNLPSSIQEFGATLSAISSPSVPGWFEEYWNTSEFECTKFGDFYFAEIKELRIVLFIR